jgi:hypothetical protein
MVHAKKGSSKQILELVLFLKKGKNLKLHPWTKREEELRVGRKQDSLCPPCSEK